MTQYLLNGFLFFIPVFIWNALFHKKLPGFYQPEVWDDIPAILNFTESLLRFPVFVVPVLFRLNVNSETWMTGMFLYASGLILYFASWLFQMFSGNSRLGENPVFRTAPAYTTAVWLTGVWMSCSDGKIAGLKKYYLPIFAAFVIIHTLHAFIVWAKTVKRHE